MAAEKELKTIDDIRDEFLLCRDLGHAWAPHDVKISRKYGEIHRILQCRSCPTQRTQILSMDGEIKRSRYEYPEGYVLKGVGYLSVADRAHVRVISTNHMRATGK
jgi:hypothetical protein